MRDHPLRLPVYGTLGVVLWGLPALYALNPGYTYTRVTSNSQILHQLRMRWNAITGIPVGRANVTGIKFGPFFAYNPVPR